MKSTITTRPKHKAMKTFTSVIQQNRELFRKHRSETLIDLDKYAHQPNPFYIFRLEDFAADFGGKFPLSRQSQHYFELVRKGNGYKTVGCSHFEIGDNMLITVPARVVHSGFYEQGPLQGYVLGFDLDFFLNQAFPRYLVENKNILNKTADPQVKLTTAQAEHLSAILEFMLNEEGNKSFAPAADEIIPVKILEFLIFSDRYSKKSLPKTEENNYHQLIADFNKLIDKHFVDQRSVNFYAAELNLHPNSLNAVVKFHSGESAKSLINRRITEESKYLLANTALSIKEIAGQIGFEDPNYFSYFFKRETNFSPLEFKQTLFLKTA